MSAGEEAELRRLRWRCRRGMRELDQLFERYLDCRWREASDDERGVFLQLLDTEDDKLWRWFLGFEPVPHGEIAQLVERIRAMPH